MQWASVCLSPLYITVIRTFKLQFKRKRKRKLNGRQSLWREFSLFSVLYTMSSSLKLSNKLTIREKNQWKPLSSLCDTVTVFFCVVNKQCSGYWMHQLSVSIQSNRILFPFLWNFNWNKWSIIKQHMSTVNRLFFISFHYNESFMIGWHDFIFFISLHLIIIQI